MELREWKAILMPYEYAVEELKVKFKNYRRELNSSGKYSPIEFVTGRVKKISSILEKCNRLDIDILDIEQKMEDIAGIRIMCQLVDDIYTMLDHIKSRKDMEVIYCKDYVKNFKESGYRSYHVVIKYPIQTADGIKDILAEIQIRTLAMNFWATIEHSLKYKYDQHLPDELAERLKRAADAAHQLDEEMREIREEIVRAQVSFGVKSMIVREITDGIEFLLKKDFVAEAELFKAKLDILNEGSENMDELELLRGRVAQRVVRAKKQIEKALK
ncbi:MAG: GTP pyrophosphokinase [Filifactoraceae bacterium]